jgi:acyl-CoA synthetase (AMP-forming)/AMP-acid ligase II
MFYYAYLKSFTEIDLRNFDLIITGGEPIRQAFLDLLFAAGVRRVANVYGLTECLPPVATNYFDRAEINYNLGEFTPGVDYRVRHGQLQLRGPNCYLPPGEWKTSGDLVVEHTEGIEFITRDVNSVRIGDHIVVIDRLREFCEQQGLDNFVIRAEEAVYLTVHQKEVILVLYCQEPVALDQLNKKIVTQLGELYRIHMIKDHRSVVRNDISKAVMQ